MLNDAGRLIGESVKTFHNHAGSNGGIPPSIIGALENGGECKVEGGGEEDGCLSRDE